MNTDFNLPFSISNKPEGMSVQEYRQLRKNANKQIYSNQLPDGENRKQVELTRAIAQLPEVDTHDVEQMKVRVQEFFDLCEEYDIRPTCSGLALAVKVSRMTLYRWANGLSRPDDESLEPIRVAYMMLDSLLEGYMMSNTIHPISGKFLMVNNMNYADKTQIDVSSTIVNEDLVDVDAIINALPDEK